MSDSANVRSVDAIREFKLGLIAFSDDARTILSGMDMEIRRTRNWLERDQLAYWRAQVKQRQADVAEARTELHRRKISQMNSDAISDTEQKEALRLAQRRLVEAEEKVEKVKRWIPVLEHAIAEYHSQAQPLGDHLAGRFENTLAGIDRMVDALEAYLSLQAPEAPIFPKDESESGAVSSTGPAAAFNSAANPAPNQNEGNDQAGDEAIDSADEAALPTFEGRAGSSPVPGHAEGTK